MDRSDLDDCCIAHGCISPITHVQVDRWNGRRNHACAEHAGPETIGWRRLAHVVGTSLHASRPRGFNR